MFVQYTHLYDGFEQSHATLLCVRQFFLSLKHKKAIARFLYSSCYTGLEIQDTLHPNFHHLEVNGNA